MPMRAATLSSAGLLVVAGLLAAGLVAAPDARAAAEQQLRFAARHEAVITGIPEGARRVRIWLVLPREDPAQEVTGIRLDGPGAAVREGGTYNNRYAYFELANPASSLKVAGDFVVTRREVRVAADPAATRPHTASERRRFRRELEGNRYVPVGGRYATLAREIVGEETNPIRQARLVYDWVLDYVEYWVKDPQRLKASPNGESDYCLATRTGNCTDFHSLYASLTRSLGIPTRLDYGSFFQGENSPLPGRPSLDGKDTDASYHCWVQFHAPGVGWVPLDVALADLLPTAAERDYYFGALEARRVTWSYGRDLTLAPRQAGPPVNAMHKVYVEVDGRPHTGWERKLTYRSLR